MVVVLFAIFIATLLEASITTLPLVLLIILFASVVMRKNEMFVVAFFAGLFLDLASFGSIGFSSLFFTLLVLIIFLYQKKFEIENLNFITIFSFIGSLLYLFFQSFGNVIFQSIVSTMIISLSFMYYRFANGKTPKFT